jgi:hypothetical protein
VRVSSQDEEINRSKFRRQKYADFVFCMHLLLLAYHYTICYCWCTITQFVIAGVPLHNLLLLVYHYTICYCWCTITQFVGKICDVTYCVCKNDVAPT